MLVNYLNKFWINLYYGKKKFPHSSKNPKIGDNSKTDVNTIYLKKLKTKNEKKI